MWEANGGITCITVDMAGWSAHPSSLRSLLIRWEHFWVLGKFLNVGQEGSYLSAGEGRRVVICSSLAKEGDLRSKYWFLASVKNLQWGFAVDLGREWDTGHKKSAYGKAICVRWARCSTLSSSCLLTETLLLGASGETGCREYELSWGCQCLSPDIYFSLGPTQTLPILPKSCRHCCEGILRVLAILCASGVPEGIRLCSGDQSCPLLFAQGDCLWEGAAMVVQPARRAGPGLRVPAESLVMCRGIVIVPILFFFKRKILHFIFPRHLIGNFFFTSWLELSNGFVPAWWNRNLVFQS